MDQEARLFTRAFQLSIFTIVYNIAEGLIAIFFGYTDESLALFGFGVDSLIEVMSGIGIAVMILRIRSNPLSPRQKLEINALRVTGIAFYLLSVGLLVGVVLNVISNHKPETTFWGVVISLLSIIVMSWLVKAKRDTGKRLSSEPIISDGNCTKVCVYMSVVLLASSLIYELTGFQYADVIGTIGLIYFSVKEGNEAFEKAKNRSCHCRSC